MSVLTITFFALNFLAATQDVAVDGWALTMLSKHNRGYASTCNSVGQTAGYFLGNVVFLALNSPDFCNKYLRSQPATTGVVTLAGFLWFWGIVFLATTTLVLIFKKEKEGNFDEGETLGIIETYTVLLKIIKLPSVLQFVVVLITARVSLVICHQVCRAHSWQHYIFTTFLTQTFDNINNSFLPGFDAVELFRTVVQSTLLRYNDMPATGKCYCIIYNEKVILSEELMKKLNTLSLAQVGFAATDSVTGLKLIEAGVPKETLAMLAIPLVPIQIILPWVISRYTAGNANQSSNDHLFIKFFCFQTLRS